VGNDSCQRGWLLPVLWEAESVQAHIRVLRQKARQAFTPTAAWCDDAMRTSDSACNHDPSTRPSRPNALAMVADLDAGDKLGMPKAGHEVLRMGEPVRAVLFAHCLRQLRPKGNLDPFDRIDHGQAQLAVKNVEPAPPDQLQRQRPDKNADVRAAPGPDGQRHARRCAIMS